MDSRANQVSIKRFVWVLVGFIQNKRALHSLLPLLPKRILIKLLVVRFVTIVTRMIATVQGLLCNGLRAPVLINGLAPFGIWLVVAIGFALASYISTASTPNTTYPAPSRQNPASGSSAWAPDGPSATLREARPAPWSADPSAACRRRPASNPAAPPSAPCGHLEVIVAVVRVVVAASVVMVIITIIIVVIFVAVIWVWRVGVTAPTGTPAPAPGRRRHLRRPIVVVIVIPGREEHRDVYMEHPCFEIAHLGETPGVQLQPYPNTPA